MTQMTELLATKYREGGMGMAVVAEGKPDQIAIEDQLGGKLSWKELNGRCNAIARYLRDQGVGVDDGVAMNIANRVDFLSIYFAVLRMGGRITAINWHLKPDEIAYTIDNCEAKVFFIDERFAETSCLGVAQVKEEGGNVPKLVSVAGDIADALPLEKILAQYDHSNLEDPIRGMQMLYTSGTTGRPKGVFRKGPPGGALVEGIIGAMAPDERDVALVTGPLYHAAPLSLNMVIPLSVGVPVVLMDKWSPEETLRLIEKHRISITHCVPTMFHRMLRLSDEIKGKYDLSSLKHIIHGAAPIPIEVKYEMISWWGPILWEYYASTEGGGHYVGSEDWLKKPGTVGPPLDTVFMKVLDDEGQEVANGTAGTVYFEAPEVGRFHYFKAEEKTNDSYRGDWYTMGDVGYKDDDGWLFLTGRSSELIISGGVNIYPAEVDAVMLKHEKVSDAATIGVPNEEFGEEVKTLVKLEASVDADDALVAELIQYCRDNMAHFKCPKSIEFRSDLGRMDSGKLQRGKLRAAFWPKK